MKTKNLHRNIHPVHWHGSMIVAVAALLITSLKSSSEMIRALQAVPVHIDLNSSVFLRDAENPHTPIILVMARRAAVTGK